MSYPLQLIDLILQGVSKVRSDCKLYLRKAFNASLGKCKLIRVRNLSKEPFKAISNKILKKL